MKNHIRLAFITTSIAVCALHGRAVAQIGLPPITLVQISGPAQAYPTEQLSLCYAGLDWTYTPENRNGSNGSFLPKKKATVTLRIVDAGSRSELGKKVISITPEALPGDPCLQYVVPAASATSTGAAASSIGSAASSDPPSTPAYIGILSVSSQPFPPSAASSSLQIFALGANGLPANPRVVPPSVTCPADDLLTCAY